ncbi:inner-membrane translocator [Chthoniobacter flavus Ellin428]|uniref:Autoinducer 2-binding protein LsrB n=1 Tax=Chthoniobacter flavus Ellin428 TaxID=497964 RepID=B4D2C3_9BACT|nr:substrate-binding domain-containing protein [Chthoniobacter flavus]EDY19363.1 inner-membrane translocator [Chthoniobacter flavus Ellin428]TCO90508.1 monosaccharide ABC transporter substrate-binding protein (CUT2 family) [Chthoniobacter flavus]
MKRFLSLALCASLAILSACNKSPESGSSNASGGKKLTIALMPKSKGNAYFISCKAGADEAAKELNVDLLFDGPTDPDPAKQNEIIENWTTLGVDVIAAACENKEGISTALKKARSKGIKVVTYDSDANPDARDFFVNQATPEGIAETLMDEAARLTDSEGEFAIITASLTAANMNEWRKHIEARLAEKYPKMKLVDTKPCDDLKDKAQAEATNLMSAYPNLKLIMAICSPAVPGAAEAVKQAGKTGAVKVIGLGLPSENRKYVHEGVTQSVVLWKTKDLGYLTIHAAADLANGQLKPGAKEYNAGRLGTLKIEGDSIVLGKPFIFNKDNIDQFDF